MKECFKCKDQIEDHNDYRCIECNNIFCADHFTDYEICPDCDINNGAWSIMMDKFNKIYLVSMIILCGIVLAVYLRMVL